MKSHTTTDGPSADSVVEVANPMGAGSIVLVCEHASNFIPAHLDNLGLADQAIESHIAWDIGAAEVAHALSTMLDAPLVAQRVSRLVYDCNRSPHAKSAIPEESEIYRVPGNVGLSSEERTSRARHYYAPFHSALSACLDRAVQARLEPAVVTIHSFTSVFRGVRRLMDLGVIHDDDSRLADRFIEATEPETDLLIERNAPYGPAEGVTHTLVEHALPRCLPNMMIEIRNDLIETAAKQTNMAAWLAQHITTAREARFLQGENKKGQTMRCNGA